MDYAWWSEGQRSLFYFQEVLLLGWGAWSRFEGKKFLPCSGS